MSKGPLQEAFNAREKIGEKLRQTKNPTEFTQLNKSWTEANNRLQRALLAHVPNKVLGTPSINIAINQLNNNQYKELVKIQIERFRNLKKSPAASPNYKASLKSILNSLGTNVSAAQIIVNSETATMNAKFNAVGAALRAALTAAKTSSQRNLAQAQRSLANMRVVAEEQRGKVAAAEAKAAASEARAQEANRKAAAAEAAATAATARATAAEKNLGTARAKHNTNAGLIQKAQEAAANANSKTAAAVQAAKEAANATAAQHAEALRAAHAATAAAQAIAQAKAAEAAQAAAEAVEHKQNAAAQRAAVESQKEAVNAARAASAAALREVEEQKAGRQANAEAANRAKKAALNAAALQARTARGEAAAAKAEAAAATARATAAEQGRNANTQRVAKAEAAAAAAKAEAAAARAAAAAAEARAARNISSKNAQVAAAKAEAASVREAANSAAAAAQAAQAARNAERNAATTTERNALRAAVAAAEARAAAAKATQEEANKRHTEYIANLERRSKNPNTSNATRLASIAALTVAAAKQLKGTGANNQLLQGAPQPNVNTRGAALVTRGLGANLPPQPEKRPRPKIPNMLTNNIPNWNKFKREATEYMQASGQHESGTKGNKVAKKINGQNNPLGKALLNAEWAVYRAQTPLEKQEARVKFIAAKAAWNKNGKNIIRKQKFYYSYKRMLDQLNYATVGGSMNVYLRNAAKAALNTNNINITSIKNRVNNVTNQNFKNKLKEMLALYEYQKLLNAARKRSDLKTLVNNALQAYKPRRNKPYNFNTIKTKMEALKAAMNNRQNMMRTSRAYNIKNKNKRGGGASGRLTKNKLGKMYFINRSGVKHPVIGSKGGGGFIFNNTKEAQNYNRIVKGLIPIA